MSATREPYLDVAAVAAWLGFGESTIRTAAAKRRLPATRIGGEWRFLESELRAFLDLNHTRAVQRLSVVPHSGNRQQDRIDRGRTTGRKAAR